MKLVLLFVFVVVSEAVGEAYEGDFCNLHGTRGVCKNLLNCQSALLDIRLKKSPPPPTCGFIGKEVIVCCKVNDHVLTTTMRSGPTTTEYIPKEYDYEAVDTNSRVVGGISQCAPIHHQLTSQPTGQKAWDKCLEYQEKYVFPCEKSTALSGEFSRVNRCHHNADELILGGTAAARYEFPHMVLLGYQFAENISNIAWKCGGALISEKFILTAGHCTSDSYHVNVSHALIGTLLRSEESDQNRYRIRRIFKHDQYRSPDKYNDIALLELDRAVTLDHTTVPACLHTGASDSVDTSRASATGWGTTKANRQANSDVLMKVILTKFQKSECDSIYYEGMRNMLKGYQETTQICYGDKTKSQDTCSGDSGGPLQVKNKRIACMYTIIGVTSFGGECGTIGTPGIYTRVSHYLSWIESIVWPN